MTIKVNGSKPARFRPNWYDLVYRSTKNILVVGLSYAFCGRTRLPEEFISENLIFVDFRQGICVYTSDQTSIGDLYAATKLQQL